MEKDSNHSLSYYTPTKRQIKEPSKEHKKLRDEIVKKFSDNVVEKLGKNDRSKCKPITLEKDQRKLAEMKPFDVPFHLRKAGRRNPCSVWCDIPTDWNTKAFPVIMANGVDIRLVGDSEN